eukprot:gene30280-35268_t
MGFNITKCKVQVQLCLERIKLQRNKKSIAIKAHRKDVAGLLAGGKQESARIRVETVIRESLMIQAFEKLEIYLQMIAVRVQLIDETEEIPRDMVEAISSVIYAAQRVPDLKELSTLKEMFASKYGKAYAKVNTTLIHCLLLETPPPEEKLAALSDIAQEHGIEWDMAAAARDLNIMTPGASVPTPPTDPPITGPGGGDPSFQGPPGGPSYPGNGGGGFPVQPGNQGLQPPAGLGVFPAGQPQFTDADQAAAYANQAAQHANLAAEFAAQFAMEQSSLPLPDRPSGSTSGVSPDVWANAPPSHYAQPSGPLPPVMSASDTLSAAWGQPVPQAGPSSGGGQTSTGGFRERTYEELQKAYDEALGPPGKKPNMDAVTAPPPTPPPPSSVLSALPGGGRLVDGGPINEEEMTALDARLEALKRR